MKATVNGILVVLVFILGIFLVLAIGGGLLALLAYGIGWLLNRIFQFDPFQATVISMAGIFIFGILAERIWQAIISTPALSPDRFDDEEDEFEDEYFDEDEEPVIFAEIPRWKQRAEPIDFSNVEPDDRCPCGSGRKYKNCHGRKKPR